MTVSEEALRQVQAGLGHTFGEQSLLLDALTHSSFANEHPGQARTNNERLEFLGDAVLQWAVSLVLWERFPKATAGELTRRRADLVCEEGLAQLAREICLGPALRLGRGEERSGGREKARLLSCAFEACIAAAYLDAGSAVTLEVCRALFSPKLVHDAPGARDFKTRLQETLQSRGEKPPRYDLVATTGPDHARVFEVVVKMDETSQCTGQGRSKLEAEQGAAEAALRVLGI